MRTFRTTTENVPGKLPLYTRNIQCTGNEPSLEMCRHTGDPAAPCTRTGVVSVACHGGPLKLEPVMGNRSYEDYKLDNISLSASGVLQIDVNSQIWAVCAVNFTIETANNICTVLGFSFDGVPYIMHDSTLKRTTDVDEVFPEYSDMDASYFNSTDLQKLNAGKWFIEHGPSSVVNGLADDEKARYNGQPIPFLEDVLTLATKRNFSIMFDVGGSLQQNPYVDKTWKIIDDVIRMKAFNKSKVYCSICLSNVDFTTTKNYKCLGQDETWTAGTMKANNISLSPRFYLAVWVTVDVISAALIVIMFFIQRHRIFGNRFHPEQVSLSSSMTSHSNWGHRRSRRSMKEKLLMKDMPNEMFEFEPEHDADLGIDSTSYEATVNASEGQALAQSFRSNRASCHSNNEVFYSINNVDTRNRESLVSEGDNEVFLNGKNRNSFHTLENGDVTERSLKRGQFKNTGTATSTNTYQMNIYVFSIDYKCESKK
ncbi:GDPD4-like protein, partial [Mya arenaria]